jgi:hypothetical protein
MKLVNEAIEDILKSKSPEEIDKELNDYEGEQRFIFRVYSGVDAFEIKCNDGSEIYLPYIDVIAKNKQAARKKIASLLNMKLEDQETNDDYVNYISDNVEFIGKW